VVECTSARRLDRMQIHINRNGQQFGPYSLEEVRTHLAQGSLLPTDLAWYEGAAAWVPLPDVPGVMGAAAPPGPPGPPPPGSAPPGAAAKEEEKKKPAYKQERVPDDIFDREHDVEADTAIYNGFLFFKNHIGPMYLFSLVGLLTLLVGVPLLFTAGPLLGGFFFYFLMLRRKREVSIGMLFEGFKRKFGHMMLAFLMPILLFVCLHVPGFLLMWYGKYQFKRFGVMEDLAGFIKVLGDLYNLFPRWFSGEINFNILMGNILAVLSSFFSGQGELGFLMQGCVIGGAFLTVALPIYFFVSWVFAVPLVMHYNIDYWTAMQLSRKAVTKDWIGIAFFLLLATAVILMGLVIFTLPIVACAYVVIYEDYFGRKRSAELLPNWLVWVFIGLGVSILAALGLALFSMVLG
tara:strand:+ start:693 stop:1910 length:1218 start_codon:yes stop_codon:yes gene_type:complete